MTTNFGLYPVEDTASRAMNAIGGAGNIASQMMRKTTQTAPGKTAGGALGGAMGGAMGAAGLGSMMAAEGATGLAAVGGPVTLGVGAALGAAAYLLS